jgi:hypothetical protein
MDFVRGVEREARTLYREKGPAEIASSLRARLSLGNIVVVESDVPYAEGVEQGQPARVMWSVLNKVVPMKLKDGRVIFRRASLKSFLKGKWTRKPVLGKHLVSEAVRRYQGTVREHLFATVTQDQTVLL